MNFSEFKLLQRRFVVTDMAL
ncbi:hypothetical protein AGR6A_Lc160121 [Agrobacterium sp. NCPPB 925]|nr:hypothetical protein AGR6A_Lc160121 [Agrobacterium sp. NCPPB 925]